MSQLACTLLVSLAVALQTAPPPGYRFGDADYSNEWRDSSNHTTVVFFAEKPSGTDPRGRDDSASPEPGASGSAASSQAGDDEDAVGAESDGGGGGGGGNIQQPGIEPAAGTPLAGALATAILNPVISGLNGAINNLFGNHDGSGPAKALGDAVARGKYIRDQVPQIEPHVIDALQQHYGPNGYRGVIGGQMEAAYAQGDSDCLDHKAQASLQGQAGAPTDQAYDTFVRSSLAPTIMSLRDLSSRWNGDSDFVGDKDLIGGSDWSFDEAHFVSIAVQKMKSIDAAVASKYVATDVSMLRNRADNLERCARSAFRKSSVSSFSDRDYQVSTSDAKVASSLRNLQSRLLGASPANPMRNAAKYVGLKAVRLADSASLTGDTKSEERYEKIAAAMLDIAIGFVPGVSWARDLYEATTGYSLTRGDRLTLLERAGALLGVITAGLGDEGIGIARALDNEGHLGEVGEVVKQIEEKAASIDHANVGYYEHAERRMEEIATATGEPLSHVKERVELALDEGERYWDVEEKSLIFAEPAPWPKGDNVERLAPLVKLEDNEVRTVLREFPAEPEKSFIRGTDVPRYRLVKRK